MALDLKAEYPSQVDTATAEFPFGLPRNVSLPGAGDGTPWEAAIVKDIFGLFAKLLSDAGLTPTGNPDTALASQYLDAMQSIFLNRVELRPVGNILIEGDRLAIGARDGLGMGWASGTSLIVLPGEARSSTDSTDIVYPNLFAKDPTIPWAAGSAGALPVVLSPTNTWHRVFIVARPDGTSDICVDTHVDAANFFSDPAAIAEGFTDATLRRRIGYVYLDGGLVMPKFIGRIDNPGEYVWDLPYQDISLGSISSVGRDALIIEHAPPSSRALLNIHAGFSQAQQLRISESVQADIAVDATNFTGQATGGGKTINVSRHFLLDVSRQIFARRSGGGSVADFDIMTEGWIDDGRFEP